MARQEAQTYHNGMGRMIMIVSFEIIGSRLRAIEYAMLRGRETTGIWPSFQLMVNRRRKLPFCGSLIILAKTTKICAQKPLQLKSLREMILCCVADDMMVELMKS